MLLIGSLLIYLCHLTFIHCKKDVLWAQYLPMLTSLDDNLEEYLLPKLPFDYNGLEPFIDEATIKVHYDGHHAAYTKKMNSILQTWTATNASSSDKTKSLLDIIISKPTFPPQYSVDFWNNCGGYVNHLLYWSTLSSNGHSSAPHKELKHLLERDFGSVEVFKEKFTESALKLFGSGYVWLMQDVLSDKLFILSTPNQDIVITKESYPLIALDLWEHAYYLKNQNRRAAYVGSWWEVLDWNKVDAVHRMWKRKYSSFHDEL